MRAQVKVNIVGHSSSPPTLRICLVVVLVGDQWQRVHTFACSDLQTTPVMVLIPLRERGGAKGEEQVGWEEM